LEKIEIGTVDGYQGREKDVILFSTVRAKGGSIGYKKFLKLNIFFKIELILMIF
jgi:superfamily I DNA and/or RNA helicase